MRIDPSIALFGQGMAEICSTLTAPLVGNEGLRYGNFLEDTGHHGDVRGNVNGDAQIAMVKALAMEGMIFPNEQGDTYRMEALSLERSPWSVVFGPLTLKVDSDS